MKRFAQRLAALEALESARDAGPAAARERVLMGFDDVRAWLHGVAPACDVRRVHQLIRLELGGLANTWVRDLAFAEALYEVAIECILRRAAAREDVAISLDDAEDVVLLTVRTQIAADQVAAVWEHNAALCYAVAEQGEPVTFRGETGGLLGLMCALPDAAGPLRATVVLMDDGRELPIGGAHGALRGGDGRPHYLAMPDGTKALWPPR